MLINVENKAGWEIASTRHFDTLVSTYAIPRLKLSQNIINLAKHNKLSLSEITLNNRHTSEQTSWAVVWTYLSKSCAMCRKMTELKQEEGTSRNLGAKFVKFCISGGNSMLGRSVSYWWSYVIERNVIYRICTWRKQWNNILWTRGENSCTFRY